MSLHWSKAWKCDLCGHMWLAVSSQPPEQCPKCRKRHWHNGDDHTVPEPSGWREQPTGLSQSSSAGVAGCPKQSQRQRVVRRSRIRGGNPVRNVVGVRHFHLFAMAARISASLSRIECLPMGFGRTVFGKDFLWEPARDSLAWSARLVCQDAHGECSRRDHQHEGGGSNAFDIA
jgi:hypothetical protein